MRANQIMTRPVITVTPNTKIKIFGAARAMLQKRVEAA